MSTLWKHQREAVDFALHKTAVMLAMKMGHGKTLVAIELIRRRGHQRVLIACPKSVVAVWDREFRQHWPTHSIPLVTMANGSSKAKLHRAEGIGKGPGIVVINYELLRSSKFAEWAKRGKWDCVILDESHRVKAPGGKTSRLITAIGKRADYRLCLTGTPCPHSPLDIYAQYRFLDSRIFGTSFARFRAKYAVTNPAFPSQVIKFLNLDHMQSQVRLIAYKSSEDAVDLPRSCHITKHAHLNARSRTLYDSLERNLVADIGGGATISVDNVLVKLLRLQQLTGGAVVDDDERRTIIVDDSKLTLMSDVVRDVGILPVVVFCKFRHDLWAVASMAKALGLRYGEVSGRVKDGLDDNARLAAGVDICGIQIQSGGVGIDLTRAATAVFYSLGYSLGDFQQACARLVRPGQESPVQFFHLVSYNTIDARVYDALEQRKNVVDSVIAGLAINAPETQ